MRHQLSHRRHPLHPSSIRDVISLLRIRFLNSLNDLHVLSFLSSLPHKMGPTYRRECLPNETVLNPVLKTPASHNFCFLDFGFSSPSIGFSFDIRLKFDFAVALSHFNLFLLSSFVVLFIFSLFSYTRLKRYDKALAIYLK